MVQVPPSSRHLSAVRDGLATATRLQSEPRGVRGLSTVRGPRALGPKRSFQRRPPLLAVVRGVKGHRYVDVLEDVVRCDAEAALERLDEIIAGVAGMFAAECVGESQGFFQLTSAHEKTRAVDGPFICS